MAESMVFNNWLIQPGNHRLMKKIRENIGGVLNKSVNIQSWPDLYQAFEESVAVSDDCREVFQPVFEVCPPTEELGATQKQIRLYRGAQVNPEALPESTAESVTVTYRGQVIEKSRKATEQLEADASGEPAKAASKPRYYRGARIE